MVNVAVTHADQLWPWCGYAAVHLTVSEQAAAWEGVSQGYVQFKIASEGDDDDVHIVHFPIKVQVSPPWYSEQCTLYTVYWILCTNT